jgi:hypothetical protein
MSGTQGPHKVGMRTPANDHSQRHGEVESVMVPQEVQS